LIEITFDIPNPQNKNKQIEYSKSCQNRAKSVQGVASPTKPQKLSEKLRGFWICNQKKTINRAIENNKFSHQHIPSFFSDTATRSPPPQTHLPPQIPSHSPFRFPTAIRSQVE
jgi:hypothetical protein